MKGNQTIKLADPIRLLSQAFIDHLIYDNCDGVLIYTGLKTDKDLDVIKFTCKRCYKTIRIKELNKI